MAGWASQPVITYDTRPAWNNTQQLELQPRHHGAMIHPQRSSRNRGHTCSAHRPHHHQHHMAENALTAATGDYVAHSLVPQLQRGLPSRPVALYMNYGTMVLPIDSIHATTASITNNNNNNNNNTNAANAVLFNAPGSTLILASPQETSPRRRHGSRDGAIYNAHVADHQEAVVPAVHNYGNYVVGAGRGRIHRAGDAVLASCPGCGLLRTTSGGYCRDCDLRLAMAGNDGGRRRGVRKGFLGH